MVKGYNRTIGAALDWSWEKVSSGASRGDFLEVIYVVVLIGLMAGFVDAIVNPIGNQGIVIYPGIGGQTVPESVINSLVIALGGAGVYLTFLSGRQTIRARAVNMYLGLALLLIVASVIMGIDVAKIKGL
jgi:nitrogen fixation/metabolism regulation signal transduction histidine kinase